MLKYYLDARDVKKCDDLVALLVSDKYKSTLKDDCLEHILLIKAKVDRGWAEPDAVADTVDNWYANRVGGKAAIGWTPTDNEKRHQFSRGNEIKENVRFVKSRNASSSF